MDTQVIDSIRSDPSRYKLCNGCGSILFRQSSSCPACGAYALITDCRMILEAVDAIVLKGQQSVSLDDLVD